MDRRALVERPGSPRTAGHRGQVESTAALGAGSRRGCAPA